MSNINNSQEKSLLYDKYQIDRYKLDLRQQTELLESVCNHESAACKAEMLLRHACEILTLSQMYLESLMNLAIKQNIRVDLKTRPSAGNRRHFPRNAFARYEGGRNEPNQ